MIPFSRQLGKRQFLRHVIFTHRSISRQLLISKTGLNARSVDRYTRELEARGLIRRSQAPATIGRPATIYISRSDLCLFLGLVIDSHQLTTTALDINGKPLYCHSVPCPDSTNKNKLEQMIVEQAEKVTRQFSNLIPYAFCLGFPTHFQFLEKQVSLQQTFQRLYHTSLECLATEVLISHEVMRHCWLQGLVVMIVLNSNMVAFQKGCHVTQHDRRLAALWHLPVPAEKALGCKCSCGKRGCLQAELSRNALQERYRRLNDERPSKRKMISSNSILLEASLGNPRALAVIRDQAEVSGFMCQKLVEELPVDHIVLLRSALANQATLANMTAEAFARRGGHPVEMVRPYAYTWVDMAFSAAQHARRHFA